MIPPQIFTSDNEEEKPNRINLENGVIPIINKLNDEYSEIDMIDLYSITKDRSELFIDGIHPNEEGHRLIADEIYKVIRRYQINKIVNKLIVNNKDNSNMNYELHKDDYHSNSLVGANSKISYMIENL